MLLLTTVAKGGIALLDEPELHLNSAVCKNIIPFLADAAKTLQAQIILCTHSPEIVGSSFDHVECGIHHLRSDRDATKIYSKDLHEMFEILRRLGTNVASTLFSRGDVFVEGEHDVAILEEGFFDQLAGYKTTSLGGRREIESEIKALQKADPNRELERLSCFIFDQDRAPSGLKSTKNVKVLQWDRYCLENYLLNTKILFDELAKAGVSNSALESRGEFENKLIHLAMNQLTEFVAREIYSKLEPQNAGIRASELYGLQFNEIAQVLANRIAKIKTSVASFDENVWAKEFSEACEKSRSDHEQPWKSDWKRICSGKRIIDDLFREYQPNVSKLEFKRRLVASLRAEKPEEYKLVESKIREALFT